MSAYALWCGSDVVRLSSTGQPCGVERSVNQGHTIIKYTLALTKGVSRFALLIKYHWMVSARGAEAAGLLHLTDEVSMCAVCQPRH